MVNFRSIITGNTRMKRLHFNNNVISDLIRRMYAVRRVKDAFREHKALRDPSEIQQNLKDANKFLEIIKRQVSDQYIYCTPDAMFRLSDKYINIVTMRNGFV